MSWRLSVLCVAALLTWSAAGVAATPKPALKAGTYRGTVRMAVVTGHNKYPATMSGAWAVTVDRAGRVRGTEQLQGTVQVPSPDDAGCTYSPAIWTLVSKSTLGRGGGDASPGFVRSKAVVIEMSSSWSTTPDSYTKTCGTAVQPWTFVSLMGAGGDTVTPISLYHLQLPLALFKTRGRTYTVTFKNMWGYPYTQTYALTSAPK